MKVPTPSACNHHSQHPYSASFPHLVPSVLNLISHGLIHITHSYLTQCFKWDLFFFLPLKRCCPPPPHTHTISHDILEALTSYFLFLLSERQNFNMRHLTASGATSLYQTCLIIHLLPLKAITFDHQYILLSRFCFIYSFFFLLSDNFHLAHSLTSCVIPLDK